MEEEEEGEGTMEEEKGESVKGEEKGRKSILISGA